ncbi:DUF2330 domain-containing protein [Mycolicibacterium arenosum]|uniref:DUF2330 domain-containing protein n=1 Tax=Mycolicibacterium arenosum TaxID=2952157 RepID=A0ABT1M0X7_9MYCO|nr:DUF2330 domain-containing protein [Mycolicibacterium sp. CAU 1645]MCP9272803.1 DUF2330 domain-containing protein [Mycolicibacterium sp. CAU 1645]
MTRGCRWVAAFLLLLVAASAVSVATPAWACGCGAYIPNAAGASVATERALIAWDGARQDVVMSFQVSGSSESAAWVMPVPSAAEVTLADAELFADLDRLTAPRVEFRDDWWPTFDWLSTGYGDSEGSAGARAPSGVNVLDRQRIGPFDVSRLAADDASALANWLADNGFPNPAGLDRNLAAYVTQRWQLVAIKLVPDDATGALTGDLQPLRLSFDADSVVYPMRLSRSATVPQTIDLYILAQHRMDPDSSPVPGTRPILQYAGRIDDASTPALEPYLARGSYLTRWSEFIAQPESIDGDYVFATASADDDFRKVVYVTRHRGDLTGLLILGVLGVGVVAATLLLVRGAAKRARS